MRTQNAFLRILQSNRLLFCAGWRIAWGGDGSNGMQQNVKPD